MIVCDNIYIYIYICVVRCGATKSGSALRCRRSGVRIPDWAGYGVRVVRSACVGYSRQPGTHAPALLNYLITSQQLAVRRTCKQQKINSKSLEGWAPCNQGPPASRAPCRAFHAAQKDSSESLNLL